MNGSTPRNADEERVSFTADPSVAGRFIPQVACQGIHRSFEAEDMGRVLDFENVVEAPPDGHLTMAESATASTPRVEFIQFHVCLRGGYLFYFRAEDVDSEAGPYATYASAPVGVIPLQKVSVEFPPGGRRAFREHAQAISRSGYELVILHVPTVDKQEREANVESGTRPPAFLVLNSLGEREKWAQALRERVAQNKPTTLRAGYSTTVSRQQYNDTPEKIKPSTTVEDKPQAKVSSSVAAAAADSSTTNNIGTGANRSRYEQKNLMNEIDKKKQPSKRAANLKKRESKTITQQVMEISDDAELATAVVEFGAPDFNEQQWMNAYFQMHNDFDAPAKCRQMELWQADMKKSLKGAVLEQYEYFVQASGEMTTMGREVATLKALIETQAETLREMKEVDFSSALKDLEKTKGDDMAGDNESGVFDPPQLNGKRRGSGSNKTPATKSTLAEDDRSVASETSSFLGGSTSKQQQQEQRQRMEMSGPTDFDDDDDENATPIEVPAWLDDVGEELSAVIRECRYNDAIELYNKAKQEIHDLIDKHERPTAYRLRKSRLAEVKALQKAVDVMGKRISDRLQETLRRKNEALKQASKRERTDPNTALLVTGISPCALKDDALYLQLLVKMGRMQDAADAYSTRRSLLLIETLHERPISGAGTVDLVIYAAQLSQSFFSCLANSVEGFLDLFLMSQAANDKNEDNMSLDDSSLRSHSSKNVPAGAVASVVLWCDGELSKFATAFGGTRILANLALSPPPRDKVRKARVVGQSADETNGSKERNSAIEVAAQCLDQAFLYASDNLDSVGLPLTPRLAEFIRPRLKGCEAEISKLLDERWSQLTADWRTMDMPSE